MKLPLILLTIIISSVSGQFDFFGAANRFSQGVGNVASALNPVPLVTDASNFADFVAQTGKTYASAAEQTLREGLFAARKNLVDVNNAAFESGTNTFKSAINAFADLTNIEFLKQLTGNKKSASGDAQAKKHRLSPQVPSKKIPDSFDWREKGGVTPVKYQGTCGSCWSFATTGAIEGHVFRKTGKLLNLSEQNLVDCGKQEFGLDGCDGGFQEYAFEYIANQKGIASNEKYPYVDKKEKCSYNSGIKSVDIKGFAAITPKSEDDMKKVIATLGPLACSVNGLESLLLYKSGIYNDEECNKGEVNHSILVVGYGTEKGQDYWIVKNSWDKNWGEDGYFKLPRGKNFCGIASECSYPVLAE